jgi:hypothetical protein
VQAGVTQTQEGTLEALVQEGERQHQKPGSLSTRCRVGPSVGVPRKKVASRLGKGSPRVQHARGESPQESGTREGKRGKFEDEAGINLVLTRRYGRAPHGERAVGSVPQTYGANVTRRGALSSRGLEAPRTGEGATEGEIVSASGKRVWGPTRKRGARVGRENLRPTQSGGSEQPSQRGERRGGPCRRIRPLCRRSSAVGRSARRRGGREGRARAAPLSVCLSGHSHQSPRLMRWRGLLMVGTR